jgi:Periplasmic copper-binding protein (NosD)
MQAFLLKRKPIFLSSLFLLSCSLPGWGASWYVNDGSTTGDVYCSAIGNDANAGTPAAPFGTINFAIATANAGDTIFVDAGDYSEGDVNITKGGIVLRGAKAGIPAGPAANPANRGTGESNINGGAGIYYGQSLDGIVVDGFTVNLGIGIRGISARGLNSVIINNIVIGTPNPFIQQIGIVTRANGPLRLHSYQIRNNNVKNCRNGIFFDGNIEDPSDITRNYASGCIVAGFQIVGSSNHSFIENVSEDNQQGLLINEGNLTIERNSFFDNIIGVRLVGEPELNGNRIQFNFFDGNDLAIGLTDDIASASGNAANFNSILNSDSAFIASIHAASFNANCNWYGTTDATVIGDGIIGNIQFVPFLNDGTDADPSTPGFQPTASCIVPVTLSAFTAQAKNYDVQLNWQTEIEVNSSHFTIEESIDQIRYTAVGRVSAQGFSDRRVNYSFLDNKPAALGRPIFYRLHMVDRDGSSKYSPIVSVTLKAGASAVQNVYPNPVVRGGVINAQFIAEETGSLQTQLINNKGQVVYRTSTTVSKGINQLKINVPGALTGMYRLVFTTGSFRQQIPILVQ